ncbi:fatty acid biosynthesis 1 [Actinidia rufa]|uniref:beta-ketoacyl-[acyl-carrier-protein] synthase I n=1 Tax=Actinidia rufa TaxID=165716 RepID=A0A7J0G572_9ERIC|nr:fatty acid biosynthesis 1 [Actinidia rufa]
MVPLKTKFALLLGNTVAVAVQPIKEDAIKKKPFTKKRRVVVTGLGVINPLGFDADIFYDNLLDGISGISEIEAFDCARGLYGWVAPKLLKRADKFMLYLLTAGKKALADGGITEDVMRELNKAKCGVVIGSSLGGMQVKASITSFAQEENPFCIPFATATMGSAMLAIGLGWMGPNYSIAAACATNNFCILNAANHIARGESASGQIYFHFIVLVSSSHLQDMMLCGGSDAAIIPIVHMAWTNLKDWEVFSCVKLFHRGIPPTKAPRPWDIV